MFRYRGTFVEFRSGLINICPVGRSCTQAERDAFWVYDKVRASRHTRGVSQYWEIVSFIVVIFDSTVVFQCMQAEINS